LRFSPDYSALLCDNVIYDALYIIFRVTPYHRNIARSIQKEAKIYFYDNGLVVGDEGVRFENLVAISLLKHLNSIEDYKGKRTSLKTLRTKEKKEVDFVLEQPNGLLAGIEVKGRDAVSDRDFNGLRVLQQQTGQDFVCGIILYRGSKVIPFGDKFWAVPIPALWV